MDPGNKYSDEIIWKLLHDLRLKPVIDDLSDTVSEEGANFSLGQRQLLCLARALLRNSPILIMDEASSALDNETEQLMQTVISNMSKTVISIAHRISNIASFDKIVVLSEGSIVEMGPPKELLKKKNSEFSSLLKAQEVQSPSRKGKH